ncbi:cytochrome b [Thiohalomonas denitrificans]|uniref:cytochrome b n=1 Tax=Thiohalomonas denitrificans TaxID=415747 RepID=UPI0026F1114C|nr:cytochrome b/b6 domain-containing protein [Thiohalomonas denitrificans]
MQSSNDFSQATAATASIPFADTPNTYGLASRVNHWLGAALVIFLLGIGLFFEDMPRGPEKLYWLKLHVAVGALALLPLAFRVVWRLFNRGPAALDQSIARQRVTRLVHVVLLAGIATLVITGPLAVWTGGRAIEVFGWFSIASPTGTMETLHQALEIVHVIAAKAMLIALLFHIIGAVYHVIAGKQRLSGRMFGRPGAEKINSKINRVSVIDS